MDAGWRRKIGMPKRRWLDNMRDHIKGKGLSAEYVYGPATWRRIAPIIKLAEKWE